ncbi:hypothetical protein [Micromonospora sp. NPDC092111]|uniref:hypothetical protein n=1 Tax=Micromonospora sp. NPDC092111 TaxID=3364289 RepID=UPI00382780C5
MSASDREVDTEVDVLPLYGQIEIGDRDAVEVPQWETGDEPAIANEGMICVATRSDADGKVRVIVLSVGGRSPEGSEVFAGELSLPSGVLVVGNSIAAQTEEIDLSPARSVVIRVFVEPRDLPSQVTVVVA